MRVSRTAFGLALALLAHGALRAADWPPVSAEELAMTSEPKAPRAPAIYLHYQDDRDDDGLTDSVYVRIKVLTDEGRKYGNLEIAYLDSSERITGIEARTIRRDGSIVRFDGTVYETPVVKAHGVRYLVKTLALPEVETGNILEYRYRRERLNPYLFGRYVFDSRWNLNSDLFIKHGQYSLVPNRDLNLIWSAPLGLPEGLSMPQNIRGRISLETHDVPAFVSEEFMPPEDEERLRVDFVYSWAGMPATPEKYWEEFSYYEDRGLQFYIDHPRVMNEAVQEIVTAGDSPETKLRKIYARVQRLRNLSFEAQTPVEQRREKLRSVQTVADAWECGCGDSRQLDWLFLALGRAAGFAADPVLVATRDTHFFVPRLMNGGALNSYIVRVTVDGADRYFDPGVPFVPFGVLPWRETGVSGLVLARKATRWIATPTPSAAESRTEHAARLKLAEDGTLAGRVTVTYTGLEALSRRADERLRDAAGRKHDLESALQRDIPLASEVTLVNQPDWDSSTETLLAEFDVTVRDFMQSAGSRRLVPAALFGNGVKNTFAHAARVHPVYFEYPTRQDDDVTITLPAGVRVAAVPDAKSYDLGALNYRIASEGSGDVLHQVRQLTINTLLLPVKFYDKLYDFFQGVRSQDEQQVVLAHATGAAAH